ncbi:C45 family autoproteolytic acyltransferase/hydolase [Paenibacillus sp. CF384]|uniref:C45 family autoproteolytic acyltransferase/hydolase n=1 Tax=Paenibacillus sp. CF384 TaxID=1884382 RepID=UPI00089A3C22|nr:C45 family peptidase [Paenibacillus sp. CF384]SDX05367.1 Predicted choloylglycine hydrolase [Paenibacillus sp. CF384]
MSSLMKSYWFRRLPALRQHAEIWNSHITHHWNLDLFCPHHPIQTHEAGQMLAQYMPELLPDYKALLSVFPNRPGQAQMLALYNLPPFFSGCSNSISLRLDHPTLIRNYDFGINEFSGVIRHEPLPEGGWIIGSAEYGWGYLDGLNHHGLAAAITFGGSFTVGDGFSIPLIVRYVLATAATVSEAVKRLRSIPHRLAQNISLLDLEGDYAVVYASPEGVTVEHGLICCTNHQQERPESGQGENCTLERFDHLFQMAGNISAADFLQEPLYNRQYSDSFGTLYTVEIDPLSKSVHYHWPEGRQLTVTSESPEAELIIPLSIVQDSGTK